MLGQPFDFYLTYPRYPEKIVIEQKCKNIPVKVELDGAIDVGKTNISRVVMVECSVCHTIYVGQVQCSPQFDIAFYNSEGTRIA